MNLLIKSAKIIAPNFSSHHGTVADVWIRDGIIIQIASHIELEKQQIIDASGQILTLGFLDLNTNIGEPGYEYKEDIASGCSVAESGGYTALAMMPNTYPILDSQATIALVRQKSQQELVEILPVGALSQKLEGKELSEMYDMQKAGAVVFSNAMNEITDTSFLYRVLNYAKGINAPIMLYANDKGLSANALITESEISTFLGMKGAPYLAEEMTIVRDLYIAEYLDSPIHFSTISTEGSLHIIKKAKQRGIKVTCDVAINHLVLTEHNLLNFDSNYKLKPPLRSEADRQALLDGVKQGYVDAIVSQHTPQDKEHKNVEFQIAEFGIIGLQTVLSLALQQNLSPELLVELLAVNPRRILQIPIPKIEEGELANLVLFNPSQKWIYSEKNNLSKSSNTPFFGKEMIGKVNFVANKNKYKTFE